MITTELIPIREQLERIEKKLDGSFKNQFLSINEVSKLTSLSPSTIYRRAVAKGKLKCSKRLGKTSLPGIRHTKMDQWLGNETHCT